MWLRHAELGHYRDRTVRRIERGGQGEHIRLRLRKSSIVKYEKCGQSKTLYNNIVRYIVTD